MIDAHFEPRRMVEPPREPLASVRRQGGGGDGDYRCTANNLKADCKIQ